MTNFLRVQVLVMESYVALTGQVRQRSEVEFQKLGELQATQYPLALRYGAVEGQWHFPSAEL